MIRCLKPKHLQVIMEDQITRVSSRTSDDSAAATPPAPFNNKGTRPDTIEQAVAYLFLCDNKRFALASALVFLHLHGFEVVDSANTLYELMMAIAQPSITTEEAKARLARLCMPSVIPGTSTGTLSQ